MKRLPAALLALCLIACGGDDAPDGGAPDAGLADAGRGPPDAGPQACERWLVEYDLSGSTFEIRDTPFNAGDALNDIGPGRARLLFSGAEGGPEPGEVLLLEYTMRMQFAVQMVETDVTIEAGPEDCGVGSGTLTSTVIEWSTPMRGARTSGNVTCNASELLCGAAGLPVGEPVPQDRIVDQPLMPFVLSEDLRSFTMAEVEVENDQAGDTFLVLRGQQIGRRCVPEPPDCE